MILLTRGALVQPQPFQIKIDKDGSLKSDPVNILVGFDVYPNWAAHAVASAKRAEEAGNRFLPEDAAAGKKGALAQLSVELMESMAAATASWSAIDGLYGSMKSRSDSKTMPNESKAHKRRARYKQIASYFQQRFSLSHENHSVILKMLHELQTFRNIATHSSGKPEPPKKHPRITPLVASQIAMFRHDNARQAVRNSLHLIGQLIACPKPQYSELVTHCAHAREWLYPIFDEWEATFGSLQIERVTDPRTD